MGSLSVIKGNEDEDDLSLLWSLWLSDADDKVEKMMQCKPKITKDGMTENEDAILEMRK